MNVGLLGAGHIARALAEGWSLPGERPGRPEHMNFFDIAPGRAAALAELVGGTAADDVAALVHSSDMLVVAVRPPQVAEALAAVSPLLGPRPLVSVAAGVSLASLRATLAPGSHVARVMPNVAAALGKGVFLFVPGSLGPERERVAALFSSAGTVVELDERAFDLGTAVAGCMPGYLARVVEAFAAAGVAGGLAPSTAVGLAVAAVRGAGDVVAAQGDPAAVIAAAATPGGMTAAGIAALEEHQIDAVVQAAVSAATAQAAILTQGAGQRERTIVNERRAGGLGTAAGGGPG